MKKYKFKINGEFYEAKVLSYTGTKAKINVNGIEYEIDIEHKNVHMSEPKLKSEKTFINPNPVPVKISGDNRIVAPIPGVVIEVHKTVGDFVEKGDVVFTVEAMKMESELVAQISGKLEEINTEKGKSVLEGDVLAVIAGTQTEEQTTPKPKEKTPPPQKPLFKPSGPAHESDSNVRAPIPGTVLDVKVKVNDFVSADDIVIILEAMKMESEIRAGVEGKVTVVKVSKGDSVQENDILIEIGEEG